ncbi:MAG: hypothetical protein GKR91_11560 [Pseudomonadales bacterium]|nr:hypothetical protein [Pseudomonadales bacterium]
MDIVDALSTVAEFSIGLAGFTGIIAIFANSRERIGGALRFRITNLLILSFAPGFFALITIGMVYFFGSEETPIRVNSFGLAFFTLLALYRAFNARKKIPEEERRILSNFFWTFNIIIVLTNFVAQLVNVIVTSQYSAGILLFGLIAILLVAAITFCMIVFQIMNAQSTIEN